MVKKAYVSYVKKVMEMRAGVAFEIRKVST